MTSTAFLTLVDSTKETTTCQFNVPDITSANFAATDALINTLNTAIVAVTTGTKVRSGFNVQRPVAWTFPTDKSIQREAKWLVRAIDITANFEVGAEVFPNRNFGNVYNYEIGTADLDDALMRDDGKWTYNPLTSLPAAWANFKTAFEAVAVSPSGGTLSILEVIHVGRNT